MRKPFLAAAGLALLVALGAAYYYFGKTNRVVDAAVAAQQAFDAEVAQARAANAEGLSTTSAVVATQDAQASFANTYKDPAGFSFEYPEGLTAGSFTDPDSGAETITVQDAGKHVGFQVYVSAWQGTGSVITSSDVTSQLPQIGAHDFATLQVGDVEALAFSASDPNFGDSRQVWFVRGGALYQASTYLTQAALLEKVVGTWQWQ